MSERRTFELANVWRDQIILLTEWRMAGVSAAGLLRTVPAFTHNFVRTAWFGDEVLWLASNAAPVFRSLTQLVWTAFPAYLSYEGQFDEVVPHLTIADRGPLDEMEAAERGGSAALAAALVLGRSRSWSSSPRVVGRPQSRLR